MEPLLEVLAGQALERALAEVLEERELAELRARQAAYQQASAVGTSDPVADSCEGMSCACARPPARRQVR